MRKAATFATVGLLMVAVAGHVDSARAASSATLTIAGATQGPAGTQVSYKYSSIYQSCALQAANPATLEIDLMWDQPAQVIGKQLVTVNQTAMECDGTVSGTVPTGAQPGDHIVTAFLVDTAKANQQVADSTVSAASAFTIPGAPASTGGGGAAAAGSTTGDTAVPFSWIGVGALGMLDLLLIAALIFALTRPRGAARRRP
jgi:hypothetical protein